MSLPICRSVSALTFLAAWNACAQTTVTPADYTLETAFFAEDIVFQTDQDNNGSFDTQIQLAGMNVREVDGIGRVYGFCSEFFVGQNAAATYSVSSGLAALGSSEESLIRALFSNALPEFLDLYADYLLLEPSGAENPVYQAEFDNLQGYAAGIQIALWEIIEDIDAVYSVDDGSPNSGIFRTDFDANPNVQADLGVNYAQTFLTSVSNSTWTDQSGVFYYTADGGADQNRIWVQIPEPSTALLSLLGLGALLRRRRA